MSESLVAMGERWIRLRQLNAAYAKCAADLEAQEKELRALVDKYKGAAKQTINGSPFAAMVYAQVAHELDAILGPPTPAEPEGR